MMRRPLALLLSLVLAAPAPAQVVGRAVEVSPVPALVAPAISAQSVIPSLGSPLALKPGLTLSAPSISISPAPAPISAAPVRAQTAAKPAALALGQLAATLPAPSTFDGGRSRGENVEPAKVPAETRGAPPLQPSPKTPKPKTAYGSLKKGLALGTVAAAAAPVAWGALPLHALAYALGLPLAVLLSAWLARGAWRLARRLARRPAAAPAPASLKRRLRALAVGTLLGVSLVTGAIAEKQRVIEYGASWAVPSMKIKRIPGDTMTVEVRRILSQNPAGREILDELRDRGGTVRMPDIMLIDRTDGAAGTYVSVLDVVFLDVDQIGAPLGDDGHPVLKDFLSDPELQKAAARKNESLMAHEYRHANQYRRLPGLWQFGRVQDVEDEAYMTEHFYAHEKLKADPVKGLSDVWLYRRILDDKDAYLKGVHEGNLYKDNHHSDAAVWKKWRADLEAKWPAHRVEGYLLLAKRSVAEEAYTQARADLAKAQEIAKANGLEIPSLDIPAKPAKR